MAADKKFWREDHQRTRMEGLRWSLQLTDRTLSGIDAMSLTFQESKASGSDARHPAYSLGRSIFINTDLVKDILSDRGIAVLMGMNYHELAHVIYTWFQVNDITDQITRTGVRTPSNFGSAYNILEEGRVEALLGARYPRMEKYFTLAVSEFVVGTASPETYFLVYGRRYLPKSIRRMYRARYAAVSGEEKALKAEALIDEYRKVLYPRDLVAAARIICEFCGLVAMSETARQPHSAAVEGTVGDKKVHQDQRGAKKDSEKAQKEEEDGGSGPGSPDVEGEADEALAPSGSGGGEGAPGDGAQPGDQGAGAVDGDDPADSGRAGGAGQPRDNGAGDPQTGQSAGRGAGNGEPPTLKEVQAAIDELVDEILQDAAVKADIQSSRTSMQDDRNGLHSSITAHPARTGSLYPVTDAMRQRSERYAEELRRIWLAMEPGWVYGASEGRLDMNRVFAATSDEELESAYSSWDEGKQHSSKATGVIVADESSSMSAKVRNAGGREIGRRDLVSAKNIWEMKKACEEVDVSLSVIMYDGTYRLLYDFDESVDHSRFAYPANGGGTVPVGAISEARRILGQADTPGKFLIVLTDGEWSRDREIEESLESMDDVVKSCGLIGFREGAVWNYEKCFDIVRRSTGDMFGMMSETVTAIMSRNLEGWY